jgi:uncharacterized membrane protein
MIYVLAFLIGLVAGLRVMTAPAAVSWGARLGWLNLQGTPLAFLGAAATPWIFSAAAIGELVNDKLPWTGSRKAPAPFIVRVVMGAACGAALDSSGHELAAGLVAGAAGAVAGTLGGFEFRARLVRAIGGRDLPIALLEDAIAVALAFWIVSRPH